MYRTMRWIVAGMALLAPAGALANTITYHPTPSDLGDLDHSTYVTWGISSTVAADETITEATLSIASLNDWQVESGDILYMHLLDNPQLGVHHWTDNEGGGDAFAGQGVLLTTYTDDDPAPNPAENWSYTFTPEQVTALNTYAGNSVFGLGFDPDCHYYNCGVTLTLTTARTPEPSGAIAGLLASSLLVCSSRGRRAAALAFAR